PRRGRPTQRGRDVPPPVLRHRAVVERPRPDDAALRRRIGPCGLRLRLPLPPSRSGGRLSLAHREQRSPERLRASVDPRVDRGGTDPPPRVVGPLTKVTKWTFRISIGA